MVILYIFSQGFKKIQIIIQNLSCPEKNLINVTFNYCFWQSNQILPLNYIKSGAQRENTFLCKL